MSWPVAAGALAVGYYALGDGAPDTSEPVPAIGDHGSDRDLSREHVQLLGIDGDVVFPLSDAQRVTRARYLAGLASARELDIYVRQDSQSLAAYGYGVDYESCLDLYYLLSPHNGGMDPGAPDPATRWTKAGKTFVNRTVDCSGGNAWMQGFRRWQRKRFAHIYGGWINTDSKIYDARGPALCFRDEGYPIPGCIITCISGSPGHKVGHEGTVIEVPSDFSWDNRLSWEQTKVVDCAARNGRSNALSSALGWFSSGQWLDSNSRRGTMFLRSIMR